MVKSAKSGRCKLDVTRVRKFCMGALHGTDFVVHNIHPESTYTSSFLHFFFSMQNQRKDVSVTSVFDSCVLSCQTHAALLEWMQSTFFQNRSAIYHVIGCMRFRKTCTLKASSIGTSTVSAGAEPESAVFPQHLVFNYDHRLLLVFLRWLWERFGRRCAFFSRLIFPVFAILRKAQVDIRTCCHRLRSGCNVHLAKRL